MVDRITALEPEYEKLSDEGLIEKTRSLQQRAQAGEALEALLPEAFANCREAARRALGLRAFDVQLMGGIFLHEGNISEMKTGEGKTLVATFPAYLNALTGKGVHIVPVNDYLARRDSEWMGKVYSALGMTTGVIYPQQSEAEKHAAYRCDITYATNNELGFDYLRDNMKYTLDGMSQRGQTYAIIDEIDSILIDEARTPLIISGPTDDKSEYYRTINEFIPLITDDGYELDEKARTATFNESGNEQIENILRNQNLLEGDSLYDIENVSIVHHINQALKAHKLFIKDKDYIIKKNEVVLIDEFTGRMMDGRRLSEGLHQAIEAKEKVDIKPENVTLASVTLQNYFRLYNKLSGMTGTAETEASEFAETYGLEVLIIPTNRPIQRIDNDDVIYRTEKEKFNAIVKEISAAAKNNQPMLVGTVSIEKAESLSRFLKEKGIKHRVLNARFHEEEASIVAQAGVPGAITIATNMAGRGTDIQLGGNIEMQVKSKIDNNDPNFEQKKAEIEHQVIKDRKKVVEAGGLYVLATERHESRRIDNQLRGRSGRQGDAGESKFYLSLEDDLMRRFGSDRLDLILKKLGLEEGESIVHPWINTALERAQKKVESRNFEIRKTLLKFDNVMNDQRKVIFEQRLDLLKQENVNETINEMRLEVVNEILNKAIPENSFIDDWDSELMDKEIKRIFNLRPPIKDWLKNTEIDSEQLEVKLNEYFDEEYLRKREGFGEKISDSIEKSILMQIIDQNWTDHLGQLEDLRQIVGIRGYGQRDPLNEYKSESFLLFENLLNKFREDVTRTLFHIRMVSDEAIEKLNENNNQIETHHNKDQNINKNQTVKNKTKDTEIDPNNPSTWGKVGRNEMCPCGSGKKYKNCHGKN